MVDPCSLALHASCNRDCYIQNAGVLLLRAVRGTMEDGPSVVCII
jgi:hypothetical protein